MTGLPDLKRLAEWDERLRERAADVDAVERGLAMGLTYVAHAYYLLGRYDEAIAALTKARDVSPGPAATIRLAEAHRGAGELAEAERLLRDVLPTAGPREHYALQHLGKTLVDAGRPGEAVALLERALEQRRELGDAELVASTELALERARAVGSDRDG